MEKNVQMDDMATFRENLMHIIAFTPEPEVEETHSIPLETLQSSDAEGQSSSQTPREGSDIDGSTRSMVSAFAENNLDQDSDKSVDSEQGMVHIQENQDNNLLRSRRLFIAKIIYVTLAALVLIVAFSFLIYFFTKGKKKYIPYRENAIDVDGSIKKN